MFISLKPHRYLYAKSQHNINANPIDFFISLYIIMQAVKIRYRMRKVMGG